MPRAGPGRRTFARLYGSEDELGRDTRHERCVGANDANRHSPNEWRRTIHRSPRELGGTTGQRRRRPRRHHAHPRTSPARGMSGHRSGSRRQVSVGPCANRAPRASARWPVTRRTRADGWRSWQVRGSHLTADAAMVRPVRHVAAPASRFRRLSHSNEKGEAAWTLNNH